MSPLTDERRFGSMKLERAHFSWELSVVCARGPGLNCVSPTPDSYLKVLTPGASECDCVWKSGLQRDN